MPQVLLEDKTMPSTTMTTIEKMVEAVPEALQNQVLEHLREYLTDLQDEWQWDNSFQQTQSSLVAAARHARQERIDGLAKPMDYDQL